MDADAERLIERFFATANLKRVAVTRLIDQREDAEAVYAEIRNRIDQQHEAYVRLLDAGQPENARNFPRA